ncbi:MAG: FAD-dependent oxidoreductase [Patescibacteria group bacterium]
MAAAKVVLPLLAEVDVLVAGGGLAGIALARTCAEGGLKTMVIEGGTFLGLELGVWQRPWFFWDPGLAEEAAAWFPLEAGVHRKKGDVVPIGMDAYKRKLEDRLLEAGVGLLYGTLPVALALTPGGWLVTVGNKSGRQAIRTRVVADATETAVTAYLTRRVLYRGPRNSAAPRIARRTVEFTGVRNPRRIYDLPPDLGVFGGTIEVYPGAFAGDHFYVDIPVEAGGAAEPGDEYEIRKVSLEAAAHLVAHVPEFAGARLGFGSLHAMRGPARDPLDELARGSGLGREILADEVDAGRCLILGGTPGVIQTGCRAAGTATAGGWDVRGDSEFNTLYGFPLVQADATAFPIAAEADVLVAGGGTAGAAAAIAAAREGARTVLLEMHAGLGGTGTLGGVNSYWFGRGGGFTREIDSRVTAWMARLKLRRESYAWGGRDAWNCELKAFALLEACREAGVQVLLDRTIVGALARGNEVGGAVFAGPCGPGAAVAGLTVDATGDGDVAAFAGAGFVHGNERDRMGMWAALVQYAAPGVYQGGGFTTTADTGDVLDCTRFILASRRRGGRVHDHCVLLAPRESRHIEGETTLTLMDQLLGRTYPDTICICRSNHDTKGVSTADIVHFGLLPPHLEIEIPFRALVPKALENIIVAGRAFSCTHDALAAARMMDDMQQMGGAAGLAAAICRKRSVRPRALDVRDLQERLAGMGLRPPAALSGQAGTRPDTAVLIEGLTGLEPFDWLEMGLEETARGVSPIVHLCAAPRDEVLPLLRGAFAGAGGARRLLLARLLLWHGDAGGFDTVADEIRRRWRESPPLPPRAGTIRFCQMPPDHGIMPETVHLLKSLAWARDERAAGVVAELAERIRAAKRDYSDTRQGIYHYIESAAYIAERLASPGCIAPLALLLGLPELQGLVKRDGFEVDVLSERLAYLAISLARALARCGAKHGLNILAEFAADNRSILARSSRDELAALTGLDCSGRPEDWAPKLSAWPDSFPPAPWRKRMH